MSTGGNACLVVVRAKETEWQNSLIGVISSLCRTRQIAGHQNSNKSEIAFRLRALCSVRDGKMWWTTNDTFRCGLSTIAPRPGNHVAIVEKRSIIVDPTPSDFLFAKNFFDPPPPTRNKEQVPRNLPNHHHGDGGMQRDNWYPGVGDSPLHLA
jgi:hypothetical protein